MPDALGWLALIVVALGGSVVAGVVGFGAALLLLPVLVWTVGARAAVPVLTITMLLGNVSRLWWSRRETDVRVACRFLLGAVPATALGAALYAGASSEWLGRVIGAFLLAAVPLRRLLLRSDLRVRLRHFPTLGLGFGFLSGVVVTTGPLMTPFFLAYGLRRGSYIATEAVCAFAMHVTRGLTFARYRLIGWDTVGVALVLGGTMVLGAWIGRRLLDRLSDRVFVLIIETLLVVLGLHSLLFPR